MSRLWAAAFLLRRLRTERGVLVLLVVLVAITSLIVAAAPRLYNAVTDAGLHSVLAETSPARRNIALLRDSDASSGALTPGALKETGARLAAGFDPAITAAVRSQEVVVDSPRFHVSPGPKYDTYVTLRSQSGLDGAIELTDGRWPARVTDAAPPGTPPVIEIAVSESTAQESGLAIGQLLEATPDPADPLLSGRGVRDDPDRFSVVGIFRIDDPNADIWFADNRLEHVGLEFTVNEAIAYATALIAPDVTPDLAGVLELPVHIQWRSFLDSARIDAGSLDALLPAVQRLESQYARSSLRSTDEILMHTDLTNVMRRYLAERSSSDAVLTVAALGPFALAGAAIGMLAVLLGVRRRASTTLARARGASTGLLVLSQILEAALLIGAAAIAGYALAINFVPGRATQLSAILAGAVALAAIAILVLSILPGLRRPLELGARDVTPPIRLAPRRLVLEATAVGLAVAGVVLLQQRGLTIGPAGPTGNALVRVDPFLAAVPILIGAAVGIVTTRLYPIPVRFLGWLAARGRGIVPVLALRHVTRRPSFAALPILVLLATAAFSSFALIVMSSLDRGQLEASWREVGADYRVTAPEGQNLHKLDASSIPGVEAAATAFVSPGAKTRTPRALVIRVNFIAIDAAAYAAVAGGPVAPAWPAELLDTRLAAGTTDDPIPAVLSTTLPSGTDPIGPGNRVQVRLGDNFYVFQIVALRAEMPGVASSASFLIAPLASVQALTTLASPNVAWIGGPASIEPDLAAAVARDAPLSTDLLSRHDWYEQLKSAPLIRVIADGFRLAFILAAAYAAISIITALTLTAARRGQDLAFLRTLGLSPRQSAGIVIVEHGVPILISLVPGLATGIAVALLLESTLGLDAFLGGATQYRVSLHWTGVAAVAALLTVVVALAIAASTWLARRVPLADALRAGEV